MKQSTVEDVRARLNQLLWEPNGQPTYFLKQLIDESFDAMIAQESYTLTEAENGIKHFAAKFLIKGFDLNVTLRSK